MKVLTEGNIRKQLIAFAIPVFISSCFSELYNITNTLLVGNYCSLESLSAVSASAWICNIFNYAFYGLGMGAGIVVAKYIGAQDEKNLKKSMDSAITFAIVGGLLLTILSEIFLPQLMNLCNIGPDIFDQAQRYLRVYLLSITMSITCQMCYNILRSFGDTKHQLYYSIIGSLVNLGLGYIFVRILHMDVIGAALATTACQIVTAALSLRLMFTFNENIKFDIKHIDFSFDLVWEICRLGIPAGFQNMLIAISSMTVQSYVNKYPNEIISGVGVGDQVAALGQTFSYTCASGTMAIVAQNMGAKKYDRVQETVKESMFLSSICTTISIVLIFVFAPQLVSIFNNDPEVVKSATEVTRYFVISYYFLNWSHVYNGACRGAGNVKYPMYIAIFGQVICKVLFVAIGTKLTSDVRILYLATPFGYIIAGLLATIYFKFSKWTKENGLRP